MAGKKSYVTPGFIAAMVVLGASGLVIVMVAATFISWLIWKYYRYLRQPSQGMVQIRSRIRDTENVRGFGSGNIGRSPRDGAGVPPGFIHSLPLLRYSKSGSYLASLDIKGHMSDCPVCLTEYKETERIRLLPNCKHMFHPVCINTWLESHTTCPLCRTEVQMVKNTKRLSAFERIVALIRRSGGAQIVDSSASSTRDRYSGSRHQQQQQQQRVTVVTPPPQTSVPVLDPRNRQPSRELQELSIYDVSHSSSSIVEAGMNFSPVWAPRSEENLGRQSSFSSSSGRGGIVPQVSISIAGSEEGCSSAGGFTPVSGDADHPER